MKKTVLILLALCVAVLSCDKTPTSVKVPVSYEVETAQNTAVGDIYIPDAGSYTMSILVKYLGGFQEDDVTIALSGLPADVAVNRDTFSKVPTYQADFVFTTANAAHGTYPMTITSNAIGSDPKTYHFNLTVRSADCAESLLGDLNGTNECTNRDYNYTATAIATGITDKLNIINFGGYGLNTNTTVYLNCNENTLTIPSQNIGNATILEGSGTFTGNSMTITYTASNTPGGFPETCNVTLTK